MVRKYLSIFITWSFLTIVALSEVKFFKGACDASAAVALDSDTILVADDEDNYLRIYSYDDPGLPISSFSLDDFLGVVDSSHPESDIEACTRVGNIIYWITSHGRSKKGKWRSSRYRLFATEILKINGNYKLRPLGRPCLNLIDALLKLDDLKLQKNIGVAGEDSGRKLAPKEYGLNIEGMTISADGKDLYIGMRNPVPGNRAILIPLKNIEDVILRKSDPKLGAPIYLNLANRGIRSIEYSSAHQMYFIIAGSISGEDNSSIYSWSGDTKMNPKTIMPFSKLNPEAIAPIKDSKQLYVLSDDGNVKHRVKSNETNDQLINGASSCKSLKDYKKKRFRVISLNPKKIPNKSGDF
tara:strand:+ start:2445 stop:3506 length:1062 start_codon:yes stop_codon:yes gene_type:complete